MRKWFRKFFSSGFFIPFVLLLPYVCTILLNGADKALLLYSPDEENLVPLLLMVQMKGDYEGETRKAQSVIARSEMYRRLAKGERAGQIMEEVSMELAGEKWEINEIGRMLKYADRLQENKNAAAATNGQVLTYNGELRLVPYHQISSGMTRNGEEVFHSTEYKYLKAVDSSRDKEAPDYINSTYVPVDQLPSRLVIKETVIICIGRITKDNFSVLRPVSPVVSEILMFIIRYVCHQILTDLSGLIVQHRIVLLHVD